MLCAKLCGEDNQQQQLKNDTWFLGYVMDEITWSYDQQIVELKSFLRTGFFICKSSMWITACWGEPEGGTGLELEGQVDIEKTEHREQLRQGGLHSGRGGKPTAGVGLPDGVGP